mmetsp:Transcript_75824/g.119777  ORF Transcript_75824/g.119777 Transcript_75824/m.119777 type:complete len:1134 (+) Transcript_75824:68-3469(+)
MKKMNGSGLLILSLHCFRVLAFASECASDRRSQVCAPEAADEDMSAHTSLLQTSLSLSPLAANHQELPLDALKLLSTDDGLSVAAPSAMYTNSSSNHTSSSAKLSGAVAGAVFRIPWLSLQIHSPSRQTIVCCCISYIAAVAMLLLWGSLRVERFWKNGTEEAQQSSRVDTLDNAKVWGVLLVMYGHILYYNLATPKTDMSYDDYKTWLNGFETLGWNIKTGIDVVSMPTLCFISGIVSQGPVTEERIRRFIIYLVIPTVLWTLIVKTVVLGFMMEPTLGQLKSSMIAVGKFDAFWNEWYLQALCFWRGSTFVLWRHFRSPVSLVAMVGISCAAGYIDFGGAAWRLKLNESFGFLPYFAIGYVFPFQEVTRAFKPTFTSAFAAVVFALVWVYAFTPRLLWEHTVDGHGSYSNCGSRSVFESVVGLDYSLYWTRRISKLVCDLVPALLLLFVSTPVFMNSSSLSWAGKHTLYPYLFHEAANHWRNRLVQTLPLPIVTSTFGHVMVLLLNFGWAILIFVALSSTYFRRLFDWCLQPAWAERLFRPLESAAKRTRGKSIDDLSPSTPPPRVAGGSVGAAGDGAHGVDGKHTNEERMHDRPSSTEFLRDIEDSHVRSSASDVISELRRRPPLPWQHAGKPFYKYLFPAFCALLLINVVFMTHLFWKYHHAIFGFLTYEIVALLIVGQVSGETFFYVLRCRELRKAMLPPPKPDFATSPFLHVVVVCAYKEPVEVLRRTLTSIIKQESVAVKPMIVMAMEFADPARHSVFATLAKEFADDAHEFIMTEHVLGPGEVAGKSSNENFAVREIYKRLVDGRGVNPFEVMVTVCDADSIFAPLYLAHVENSFWQMQDGRRLLYNGPLNTYRNMSSTNILIQFYEMSRSHLDTFKQHLAFYTPQSNYSLTLGFAAEIDFWTPDNISEDQQTGLKATINNFGSQTTVFVPSFICNDLVEGMADRWVQAKRHQWGGVESMGWLLAIFPFVELRCWMLLFLQEWAQGQLPKSFRDFLSGILLVIFSILTYYDPPSNWLLAVGTLGFCSLVSWISFWCAECFLWKTALKQFPIEAPSFCQGLSLFLLAPVLNRVTRITFGNGATIHCMVHAMFNDSFAYVNAPKGTDKQRAEFEALVAAPVTADKVP